MADFNASNHIMENPPTSPSIPLQLCGFITGDTVQVDGDTGNLQFSVQFNVRKTEHQSPCPFNFPDTNIPEVENFYDSLQSPPSSPHLTATCTHENQDLNADDDADANSMSERCGIVTRLRSGVLSPVNYCFRGIYSFSGVVLNPRSRKKKKLNKGDNVFDKMLKRRCSPIRPCGSYTFFLMKNWGVVKRSSFVETSRRLSKQWCKLPRDIKKEYEEMSMKDNARYKRQCVLLRSDVEQHTTSDLLAISN